MSSGFASSPAFAHEQPRTSGFALRRYTEPLGMTGGDRALVDVCTAQAREQLINSRLAYVSVSRARYDAEIYTNDAAKLGKELSRDVSKQSALETKHEMGGQDQSHTIEDTEYQSVGESHKQGQGRGLEH